MTRYVIGADLGGTKIELGLVDPSDRIIARKRIPTEDERGAASVVERIAACVAELAAHLPAHERIAAMGMCTPGPVDHVNGILLDPPNVQGLHNAPLGPLLTARLGIPVRLEHDAKAAALGEFYFGAGRGEQSMVYIIVGTGVGAALIMDGAVYRGLHNSAGEFGHTVLDRNGLLCSCGNRGCVETFMSGPRLAQWYELMQASHQSPVSSLQSPLTGETVATLAGQDDPVALKVITQAGEALGAAIATLAMIVNIDLYVVGGSVAKCGELLLAPARQAIPRHAFASVASHVRVVASGLDTDAPILGCAWLARQHSVET
ncbi:MAG: ROK family protein [Caldilinea sp. CFX5]|nr:ROK family protein [Caldilinea sp. CFX5]